MVFFLGKFATLDSPCDRLSRLKVLWASLTPHKSSDDLLALVSLTSLKESVGSPKFSGAPLPTCHDLKPRQFLRTLTLNESFVLDYVNDKTSPIAFDLLTGLNCHRERWISLWPTGFPVYASIFSFILYCIPPKLQHLVRVAG